MPFHKQDCIICSFLQIVLFLYISWRTVLIGANKSFSFFFPQQPVFLLPECSVKFIYHLFAGRHLSCFQFFSPLSYSNDCFHG